MDLLLEEKNNLSGEIKVTPFKRTTTAHGIYQYAGKYANYLVNPSPVILIGCEIQLD